MKCTHPRTVGFKADGKTLAWSQKDYSKEYPTFQLPCRKCIECRLDYAREWAVRCMHESQMYENNCFITLTYDDEHLESPKLIYKHFQDFMKRLRYRISESTLDPENSKIGVFVTGEYGEKTKRPHWHALIFNWRPTDAKPHYENGHGDQVYTSTLLTDLWGKGHAELGDVTFKSAGYCARYAAKKLVHGSDEEHDYHPISKKSSHQAIGKKWIEKYWKQIVDWDQINLPDGSIVSVPRYYQKWLAKNKPEAYLEYLANVKTKKREHAEKLGSKERAEEADLISKRGISGGLFRTRRAMREIISKSKFKKLQEGLKL